MSTKDIIREGKKSFTSELSANPTSLSGAVYKTVRLPPINNGQAQQSISEAGTTDVTFQITPRVMNLAKTKLFYQMQIGAQAANQYTMVHNTSFGEIQYISLTPESGRTIAEVQYANNYLRMIGLMNTDREQFLDQSKDDGWYTSQVDATAALNPTASPARYVAAGAAGGTAVAATIPNLEVKHLDIGNGAAAVYPAANAFRNRKVPLGLFKGTVFSLDKDIYFPCNMTLKVTFAVPKIGFSGTAVDNPNTGALALTGDVVFKNINLLIQQETREDIIQQVKAFYSKPGVTIPIEWLKVQKNGQQGNQHNPQMNISSSDGKFIRRIITSPFASTETSNYGLDNSNICAASGAITQGKVINYRSMLDNNPIQNYDISCVPTNPVGANAVAFPSDDWELNRKFLSKSAVMDIAGYQKSWFHIDDFLGVSDSKTVDSFTIGGLPTVEPHRYEIVAQTCQDSLTNYLNLNWYMYAITGRDLVFNGSGVDIL